MAGWHQASQVAGWHQASQVAGWHRASQLADWHQASQLAGWRQASQLAGQHQATVRLLLHVTCSTDPLLVDFSHIQSVFNKLVERNQNDVTSLLVTQAYTGAQYCLPNIHVCSVFISILINKTSKNVGKRRKGGDDFRAVYNHLAVIWKVQIILTQLFQSTL